MDIYFINSLKVGDIVHDDLTNCEVTVIKITKDKNGNIGIWLDHDYLDGGRHPWEISECY